MLFFSGHSHSDESPQHNSPPKHHIPKDVIEALQRSGKSRGEHNAHPGPAEHHPEGAHSSHLGKGHNFERNPEGGRPIPPKRVRQRISRL